MELHTKQGLWRSAFALILAVVYDWIFYQKGLGLNFPIFMTVALVGFAILSANTKQLRNQFAWWLTLPLLALSAAPAIYSNTYAHIAAPILAGLTFVWFTLIMTVNLKGLGLHLSGLAFPKHLDALVTNWRGVYSDAFSWREGQAKKVVWGIVIAFPLLIIFATLLASADQIFAEWLKNLNIWEGIWRVFRTVMMTLFAAAFLYLLGSDKNAMSEKIQKVFKMEAVTVGIVLALLNALFGLFVFIQIKYLFGGAEFVLANNVTFADYARNGFFELVRVLILAAVIIILVHRSFSHHGSHPVINTLQAVFIAQIGVVAYSALYRMNIYQDAFGFTSLRLYVEWFIYSLFAMLIWSGIALVSKISFRRFFLVGASMAVVVAATVSLVNVDYLIAAENINRFLEKDKGLDVNYLSTLSQDTVPAWEKITTPANFVKLNITQQLTVEDTLKRYGAENASSTALAFTWSEYKTNQKLSAMQGAIAEPLTAAHSKDTWYNLTQQQVQNNLGNYLGNCLRLPTDASGVDKNDLRLIPIETVTDVRCVEIGANPTRQAELVIKTNYNNQDYTKNTQTYSYRVVVQDGQNVKTEFQTELKTIDEFGGLDYSLQKNGDLVEFDFNNRDIIQYTISENKLQKTSLYAQVQ